MVLFLLPGKEAGSHTTERKEEGRTQAMLIFQEAVAPKEIYL